VANWLSDKEIEIRNIAVLFDHQGHSVGRHLMVTLIEMVEMNAQIKIQTYARNTSGGFFAKLGFIPTNEYLEHPDFARHGITIQKMYFEKESLEFL
jgi:N-acetylglutamate synthase-like GNAT family acetyltransferase